MRFWPRKKPKATPADIVKQIFNGFFTTHSADMFAAMGMKPISLEEAMKKSLLRTPADFKVYTPAASGTADGTAVAMDEAYPNLQLAKIQNSFGGEPAPAQLIYYSDQGFMGYQICAIIAQHWLVDKACTMPARDAVRHGYEVTLDDGTKLEPKVKNFIRKRDKYYNLKGNCVEFLRFGRQFGIRIAIFEVDYDDPLAYEKPFNIDGVKKGSYRGISQVDPYWITPLLDGDAAANPASKHFYEPTWWMVNGKRYHRSHLVITRNGDEPADILKPTYFYGGIPVPQKIAELVFGALRTTNEAPMLALTKRMTVLYTDIAQAVSNMDQFNATMSLWTQLRDNFGVKVAGTGEKIEQHDTSLTDLDAVIMTLFQIVAAASDVPATKLMGTSPKGFGATGDYEIESYHEFLESIQEHDLTPFIERHHLLLMKSEVEPKFGKMLETEIVWNPLDTPTAKELSEINLAKAQTGNNLVQSGAIDGTDERNRIIADKDSGYTGIPDVVPGGPGDREAQQEAEAALEQPVTAKPKNSSEAS